MRKKKLNEKKTEVGSKKSVRKENSRGEKGVNKSETYSFDEI